MATTSLSLLERVRTGADPQSWSNLVALYTPWLEELLRRGDVPAGDRDDLKQDVLVVVYREIDRFEHNGQVGAFRRWLRNIALNRLRNYRRQQRNHADRFVGAELDGLPDRLGGDEAVWEREHDEFIMKELLKQAEPSFTQSTWKAFCLQVLHEWDVARTAAELGISVNAALLAKSRVLQHLRREAQGILDDI